MSKIWPADVSDRVAKTALTAGLALSSASRASFGRTELPLENDVLGDHPVRLADVAPALAEFSGVDRQDLVARRAQVGDGRFIALVPEDAQDVNVFLGSEDVFQAFGHLHENLGKFRRSVMDDRLGGGRKHARWNGSRARRRR